MEESNPIPSSAEAFEPRAATSLRELEQRARNALSAQRKQISRLEDDITKQLESIVTVIADQRVADDAERKNADQAQAEIDRLRDEDAAARAAWNLDRAKQEAELGRLRAELEKLSLDQAVEAEQLAQRSYELDARDTTLEKHEAALAQREAAVDERIADLEASRDAEGAGQQELAAREAIWNTEKLALETERDDLLEKIATLQSQKQTSKNEWQGQLEDFEQRLREQQASWSDQRSEWVETQSQFERECEELQQKFDLALQDVQRFRARAADLEQELARRPEANQADSAELVALRAERDALAERVEQLERQPVAKVDPNTQQQLSDLQRRFELAVEDVRELKTKNAQLESRLASAGSRPAVQEDSGGTDWESQKRRMLASLAEDPDDDQERQKERATIESTIEMTDAVVAEKDQEIRELKAQLAGATQDEFSSHEEERRQQVDQLLDADEVIAEHRTRIAQLERDMEDKLRTAELELSIERAKLARHKVELEALRVELESQRNAYDANGGAATGGPRRRWLSKLGLSGEEQA